MALRRTWPEWEPSPHQRHPIPIDELTSSSVAVDPQRALPRQPPCDTALAHATLRFGALAERNYA